MYNGGKIITGLVLFVGLATFPFYYNIGKPVTKPDPKFNTHAIEHLEKKECVESKEFMRANHMKLLNEWRNAAVRDGTRVYVSTSGKKYDISFQNTCLDCHSNPEQFCDECHSYVAAKPNCWQCHFDEGETKHEH